MSPRIRLCCALLAAMPTLAAQAKTATRPASRPSAARTFAPAPRPAPGGPLDPALAQRLETTFGTSLPGRRWTAAEENAIAAILDAGDLRLAWVLSDLLRCVHGARAVRAIRHAAAQLMGFEDPQQDWQTITDHLMAWDIPAPPGYLDLKRAIYTAIDPRWAALFVEGDVDWRLVSWGGVLMDDRPTDRTDDPCNCIPAADDPPTSDADGAAWLPDSAVVFGIRVGDATRAYPRRIMEVREMVNDTLGGRRLGIPYCTLCGAAQAFLTDRQPEGVGPIVLRTSGLLSRSNKVMFDLTTHSVFDTFKGEALTGPLAARGVKLDQVAVVTTTWGAWRRAHPKTKVLVERLALGRDFDFRNGRDANGPIFPIGKADPRLPVQADVLGLINPSGTPVAFAVAAARAKLARGERVRHAAIELVLDGDGLRAVDENGRPLASHQAFWFAWSQFYPNTALWR